MKEKYNLIVDYITSNQKIFYRICYTYLKNEQDSLDAIQNAIYKALSNYKNLRETLGLKKWFYRILVNESLQIIRKDNKYVLVEDEIEIIAFDEYSVYNDNLYDDIDKLPTDIKTVIVLRFFEDLKLDDIAIITQTNVNTVKYRLYRGLDLLRLNMEKENYYE